MNDLTKKEAKPHLFRHLGCKLLIETTLFTSLAIVAFVSAEVTNEVFFIIIGVIILIILVGAVAATILTALRIFKW